jgi:uncharacterized membrane protein YccC
MTAAALAPPARWFTRLRPIPFLVRLAPADIWPDAIRMTLAAVLAYLVVRALHLQGGTFAVITSLMVTRAGAAGGVRPVLERLGGMALGAATGAALVGLRLWHVPDPVLVALAMVPLCLVVARFRKFQSAPMTAMIVLSAGAALGSALRLAGLRLAEVCIGAAIGFLVTALVLRRSTDQRSRQHAGAVLTGCGALLAAAAATGRTGRQTALRARIRDDMRLVFATTRLIPRETGRAIDAPQIAALMRLQQDVNFLARAFNELNRPWRARVQPTLERLADAFQAFCAVTATHLTGDTPPPSLDAYDAALRALRTEAAARFMPRADEAALALPFLLTRLRADLIALLPGMPDPDEDEPVILDADPSCTAQLARPQTAYGSP